MASEKLVISLLGPPEIKVGNKLLHITRRMFRYIIFYLACQPEPVSRESLCELFWPHEDESVSRKNLREVISKLRHDLPIDGLILTEKEYVSFDKTKIEVDVLKFNEVYTLVRKNLETNNTGKISDAIYVAVQDALNLWRTDYFLGGVSTSGPVSFQHWVINTSENLQYWRQMMIEWLADHCIVIGNFKEALSWLSLARMHDPINTEINLLILTCLRDLNMWSEALHFCTLLETDYPANDEKEIPVSLRDLIVRVRQESKNLQSTRPITWASENEFQGNFVGRTSYLSEMSNAINRGGILLIRGEKGGGKSRLIKEFYEHLDVLPNLFYYIANQGDEKIPYRALVESARKVTTGEIWQALDPVYALILVPLFPEIVKFRNDVNLVDFSSLELNERLVPDAFLQLISLVSKKKKTLFLIDNAHWLDEKSISVIAYLQDHIRRFKTSTIIMTARSDIPNDDLVKFMERVYPGQLVKEMNLCSLQEPDVEKLFSQEFPQNNSSILVQQLLHLSGGNPKYLELMIESLKETKFDVEQQTIDPEMLLGESILRAIEQSVRSIDASGQKVLRDLSILGDHFHPILIERMTGLEGEALSKILQNLCERRILEVVEPADGGMEYRFVHKIISEYFKKAINPYEKKQLHLKVTQAIIENEGEGDAQAARLAFHFQAAGKFPKAVIYWVRAGTFAKKNRQTSEAYEMFQNAFDLVQRLGTSAPLKDVYELTNEWGDLALQLDDMTTFSTLCSTCLRLGESRNDQRLIGFGKSGLGWVAHFRGYFDISTALLSQAIQIFQRENYSTDLMDAYLRMGTVYFVNQDFHHAIELFDKLMKIAITLQNSEAMSFYKKASAFVVYAYCVIGKLGMAQDIANKGMTIAQTLGESNYTLQLRASESIIHYYSGDLEGARLKINAILPEIHALKMDWWWFALQIINCQAALEEGDVNACWSISQMMAESSTLLVQQGWGERFGNYLKGEIYLQLNDLEDAETYYRTSNTDCTDDLIWLITRLGLVKVEMKRRHFDGCKSTLELIVKKAENHGFEMIRQGAKLELLKLALSRPELRGFKREFAWHSEGLKESEFTGIRLMCSVLEGKALLKTGDLEKGRIKFIQALEEASNRHYFWIHLAALESLINCGSDQAMYRKAGKRLLEKTEFSCEVPELTQSLTRFSVKWPLIK